jgi:hypothetical protein
VSDILKAKEKLEAAQREYEEAITVAHDALLAQRAEIDRKLAELGAVAKSASMTPGGGTRRSGIKKEMMNLIKGHQSGMPRADILKKMGVKGDKSAESSISNALANAKRKGELTQSSDGTYKAVPCV